MQLPELFSSIPGLAYVLLFGLVAFIVALARYDTGERTDGAFVAEVWLEWPVCRGSTMYRARFDTEQNAQRAARLYAAFLDWALPKRYRDTDWCGKPCWYEYDFGIHFGVRPALPNDSTKRILCATLPGHRGFNGEHSSAHPLNRGDIDEQAKNLGYKV